MLGSSETRKLDVRVIAATNRELPQMVEDGSFREDLFYRINLITMHLPSLAERRDDIPPLVLHFLEQIAGAYGGKQARIGAEALHWLQAQEWPGNVRQLRHVIERTLLISGADELQREQPYWLLGLEAFFLLSFFVGLWLIRSLFEPIKILRSAVDFIRGHDFSTRLREVGQKELDPLIEVYNRMAETLREERIRSEEQEHFLQRIVSASPSGMIMLDLEGRVTTANPSAAGMLQIEADVLQGKTLEELGSPLASQIADLRPDEARLVSLQGRRRIRCTALSFMDRGFARRFILMEELTEELHRSEKAAYEKLIRMMSHEVNNTAGAVGSLLNSCLAYSDQIDEQDRDDFAQALGVAIARTGRMNRFMQEFADVVRLPAPTKQPYDLEQLLEEVGRLLREESAKRSIRWEWEVADGLPRVALDAAQMEQVFINICKNALEAIDHDGVITVRTGLEHERPFVIIRDSGGGISEGVRPHLFTPFYTSKENGQGIGLTMVQEILLGHGFDFSLESDGEGGTEFTLRF